MKKTNSLRKFKGLRTGRDWESGDLKLYGGELAAIFRGNNEFYVFKDSVSIFTGFVNVFGQEIYEGDLLGTKENDQEGGLANCVFWDGDCQQWKVRAAPGQGAGVTLPLSHCLELAVVGHEFTHQHLLSSPEEGKYRSTGSEANL